MPAAPARHPALHRPRQSMPPKFLTAVPAAVHKRIFMTADQDTPVAASAAPDTMEKETPKPRRRAAPRSKTAKTASPAATTTDTSPDTPPPVEAADAATSRPAPRKRAVGKRAAAATAAPTDTPDTPPATEESPQKRRTTRTTSRKKTSAAEMATGQSAATAPKPASKDTASSAAPEGAPAAAAAAENAAPRAATPGATTKASGRSRSAAGRAASRSARSAVATADPAAQKAAAATAAAASPPPETSAAEAETAESAATPHTTTKTAGHERSAIGRTATTKTSGRSAGGRKSRAAAKDAAPAAPAALAADGDVRAPQPAGMAVAGQQPGGAAALVAPERKELAARPAQGALASSASVPALSEAASPPVPALRPVADVPAVEGPAIVPVAPGEGGSALSAAGSEADAENAAEAPRRKNRRGRRGGRGRSRKKDQNGQENGATATPGEDDRDAPAGPEGGVSAGEAQSRSPIPVDPQTSGKTFDKTSGQVSAQASGGKSSSARGGAQNKRRMYISVLPGEQVEVALAENGQVLEYYLDMLHQRKIKGNIYKGVIHNIDTNLQAAFVSYGAGKNGFLQIDEVHPEYWLSHHEPAKGKKFPPIQKVLKAGQEVLVQVVKEPTGSKGAFLTTWISLAGRFLVLTPGQEQIGVSRKVEDDEERSRLRELMNGIDPGQNLGVIVRTVSAGTTKTTLRNDLQYLKRVWRDIRKKGTEVTGPALVYQEPGLSERAVRDYLTDDVGEIWVDNEEVAQSIRETVSLLFPRKKDLVHLYTDVRTPMWDRFNLRRQLDQIYTREVQLPSGGRLVFDQTEALMAIDINSGKISGKGNFEAMAHKTNMEAAEAIARHLKLRDIGGQVVIDFIEMRDKKHVLEVEKTLRTAMKGDRARHDVGRMSSFGLLELVRQRTGSSALSITMEPCPACGGTGQRRNLEWQALQALGELRRLLRAENKDKCVYPAPPELALYLLNHKRDTLRELEQDFGKCLEILVRP